MGMTKSSNAGRKSTPFATRKIVWDFYHKKATPSTNTTPPARLRLTDVPKIQSGLNFVDTTTITLIRNRQFYENVWMMLHCTYYELYVAFLSTHPGVKMLLGTFCALKPFYIRTETEKDVEMCCCKLHLHARWAILAMIICI